VNEAVIIAKDIFRRFPNKYEKIIGDIVAKLAMFTEPEAKCAMVWILGEYA
jgi:AP-1 complex subunit beta-1